MWCLTNAASDQEVFSAVCIPLLSHMNVRVVHAPAFKLLLLHSRLICIHGCCCLQITHKIEQQTIRKVLQPIEQSLAGADSPAKSDSAESGKTDSGKADSAKADSGTSLVSSAVIARAEEIVQQCLNRTSNVQDLHKRYQKVTDVRPLESCWKLLTPLLRGHCQKHGTSMSALGLM